MKYKGVLLDCGYEIDILVDGLVIIEIKAVEKLHPVHEAQLFTYLKLYGAPVGLLMNFHSPVLRTGLKRIVHNF